MEHTGPAKTTMFERALDVSLGLINVGLDNAPTPVEKPNRRSEGNRISYDPNKKPKRVRRRNN